jgi:dihydroorotase
MLIRQATVLDPSSSFHGKTVDVLVQDGAIEEIGSRLDAGDSPILEGEDLYISSGWVDAFADYREPGFEQKETIATGLAAAAAGGFTDVLLVPNTMPVADGKAAIQFALQRAAGNIVNLHPLGAVSRQGEGKALAEMLDMRAYGAAGFTDGWKPVQSSGLLLKALEYVKAFGGQIIQLPVDEALAAGGLMHEGEHSTRLGMPGIPTLAETLLVHRDIELARYTGSRLHLTGISTAASVQLIRAAKAQGIAVTCSVTPYHLVLNDAVLETYNSLYKVMPPLRSETDRQALIAGVKDGTIDCIASHHRPQDWDAKHREFEYAGEGMAIQEIVFPLLWNNLGEAIGLDRLTSALGSAPRRIFGLPSTTLEKGAAAPMTVFTTSGTRIILREIAQSLAYNNPFFGQSLQGKVLGIFNNGKHLNQSHV